MRPALALTAAVVLAALVGGAVVSAFTATATVPTSRLRAATTFPPVALSPPAVSGTPRAGATLIASDGTWSRGPVSVARVWLRCDPAGEACAEIPGATGVTYVPTSADVGARLRVRVTATNEGGATSATSAATEPVAAAPTPPVSTAPPVVSGVARLGQTLTATTGSWAPAPDAVARQWQRCTGGTCADVSGATGATHVLTLADVGATMRVRVTATNAHGTSAPAFSAPTAAVAPLPPSSTSPPRVTGRAEVFETVTADDGAWAANGAPITARSRTWERCATAAGTGCVTVAGDTTHAVDAADRGAHLRVRVRATNSAGTTEAVSATVGPVTDQRLATLVRQDGAHAYWRLNETGTTMSSEQGHTAVRHGNAVAGAAGVRGADRSVAFSCCFSQLKLPGNLLRDWTGTLELWFRTSYRGALAGYQNTDVFAGATNFVPLAYVTDRGLLAAGFYGFPQLVHGARVDDDRWHHLVLTQGSGFQHLYVDGVLSGSSTGTHAGLDMVAEQLGNAVSNWSWPGAPGGAWDYTGRIDELALYGHRLGADRVRAHWDAGRPDAVAGAASSQGRAARSPVARGAASRVPAWRGAPPLPADTPPHVTGAAWVGERLEARSRPPHGLRERLWWERCRARVCRPIPGATRAAHRLTRADVGHRLRVRRGLRAPGAAEHVVVSGLSAVVRPSP